MSPALDIISVRALRFSVAPFKLLQTSGASTTNFKSATEAGKAICAPEYTITRTCRRFSYNDYFFLGIVQEWGARGSKLFRPHIFDSG